MLALIGRTVLDESELMKAGHGFLASVLAISPLCGKAKVHNEHHTASKVPREQVLRSMALTTLAALIED